MRFSYLKPDNLLLLQLQTAAHKRWYYLKNKEIRRHIIEIIKMITQKKAAEKLPFFYKILILPYKGRTQILRKEMGSLGSP